MFIQLEQRPGFKIQNAGQTFPSILNLESWILACIKILQIVIQLEERPECKILDAGQKFLRKLESWIQAFSQIT